MTTQLGKIRSHRIMLDDVFEIMVIKNHRLYRMQGREDTMLKHPVEMLKQPVKPVKYKRF